MPFDDTGFLAILADDTDGADAHHADHPAGYYGTIGSTALYASRVYRGTSGDSVTIGTGPKSFTLDSPKYWKEGDVVRIKETGTPATNFMVGALIADETSEAVITVNVTTTGGSGTYTSWEIVLADHTTTVASPPLAVADGGTGGNTSSTARNNLQAGQQFDVMDILSNPPGSPSTNDAYLIGDAPSGAWASNEGDVATWNGTSWDFVTPEDGAIVFDAGEADQYLKGGAASAGSVWDGSEWVFPSWSSGGPRTQVTRVTTTVTIDRTYHGKLVLIDALSGNITLTLPNETAEPDMNVILKRVDSSGNTVTINVESSGNIDGASSQRLASQYDYLQVVAWDAVPSGTSGWMIVGQS